MPDMQSKTETDSELEALLATPMSRQTFLKLFGLGGGLVALNACGISVPPFGSSTPRIDSGTPGSAVDISPVSKDLPPVPEVKALALYRYSTEQIPQSVRAKFKRGVGEVKFLWVPLVSSSQIDIAVNEIRDTAPGRSDKIVTYTMGVVAVKLQGKQIYEAHMCLVTFANGNIESLTVAGLLEMSISDFSREYVYPQTQLTSVGIENLPLSAKPLLALHVGSSETTFTYNFPAQQIESNGSIQVDQLKMEREFREFAGIDIASAALELNAAVSAEVVVPDAETVREVQAALQRKTPNIDLTNVVIANVVIRTAGDQNTEPITLVLDKNENQPILDANGTVIPKVSLLGTFYRANNAKSAGFQDALHNVGFRAASLGQDGNSEYIILQELAVQLQKNPATGRDIIVVGDGKTIQIAFSVELGVDGVPTPDLVSGPQASLVLLSAHTTLGTKNLPPMDKSIDVSGKLVKELVPGIEKVEVGIEDSEIEEAMQNLPAEVFSAKDEIRKILVSAKGKEYPETVPIPTTWGKQVWTDGKKYYSIFTVRERILGVFQLTQKINGKDVPVKYAVGGSYHKPVIFVYSVNDMPFNTSGGTAESRLGISSAAQLKDDIGNEGNFGVVTMPGLAIQKGSILFTRTNNPLPYDEDQITYLRGVIATLEGKENVTFPGLYDNIHFDPTIMKQLYKILDENGSVDLSDWPGVVFVLEK